MITCAPKTLKIGQMPFTAVAVFCRIWQTNYFRPSLKAGWWKVEENRREIKLDKDHYINRLMCFTQDNSSSSRFEEIVGSHLRFLGDRLDAIFKAAQKGSHASVGREEANRYVVYTYMLVGDILSLKRTTEQNRI